MHLSHLQTLFLLLMEGKGDKLVNYLNNIYSQEANS